MKRIVTILIAFATLVSCGGVRKKSATPQAVEPTFYTYEVVAEYPHLRTSYTQGLQFIDGELWEGTGEYGRSQLLVKACILGTKQGVLLSQRSVLATTRSKLCLYLLILLTPLCKKCFGSYGLHSCAKISTNRTYRNRHYRYYKCHQFHKIPPFYYKGNKKRKTESGKRKTFFLFFGFCLECKNGTDAAERAQSGLAHSAEPRGGKACAAGLKRKAENFFLSRSNRENREFREF
ncbi:MAG: glutaminyl-peptide cyclotransferase [Alistipes sp.]|nr:glutaminyl-peptide cyclotransferase [Alistipes sp.]